MIGDFTQTMGTGAKQRVGLRLPVRGVSLSRDEARPV